MKTIAVQLTGRGVGAIAVVLLAGDDARAVLGKIVAGERAGNLEPGKFAHASLLHPTTRAALDGAVIVCTTATQYELHLHGGIAVVDAVLEGLRIAGATRASLDQARNDGPWGDGLFGEALLALPTAQTMTAAKLLAAQPHEGLAAWIERWLAWLPAKTSNDLWRLHSATQWLLARSATLEKLLHPARIAILGPPNAGKSTLANALLGRPISITSDIAGTTRDWVDAQAVFVTGDIAVPVTLIDTAGLRETQDIIEQQSIARSHEQASGADLLLLVFDASVELRPDHFQLFETYAHQRVVAVANKVDAGRAGLSGIQKQNDRAVEISAKTHTGLGQLMQTVLEELDLAEISSTEAFAFTSRQRRLLSEVATESDPRRTVDLLQQIKGYPHDADPVR